MENSDKKKKVALNSVFWSVFLTLMKGIVGLITGSLGILSEALHSALDLGAALLTYFAVKAGDKPADKEHPYGHAKVEAVSALVESALLFVTSGWIIYEAIKRLFFEKAEIEIVWYAFLVIIISIIVDISRSRALLKIAKETNSQALEADALHFSSDIWSSGAVLVGLICTYFKIPYADTLAALVVAIVVLHAGYKLSKRTFDVLIDTAPAGTEELVTQITQKVAGVIGVEKVRARVAGASLFIDVKVNINKELSLIEAKKICEEIEKEIKIKNKDADVMVHIVPKSIEKNSIIIEEQIEQK